MGGAANHTIEYAEDETLCVVKVTGEHRRPKDSSVLRKIAFETFRQKGIYRFLFDLTKADVVGGVADTYEAGTEPIMEGLHRTKFKVALVYDEPGIDERFLETVMVNRGYRLRVFGDEGKALAWLKEDPEEDVG
jgi:hypothetical protein